MIYILLGLAILAVWFNKYRNVPLDRDYTPYAYPAFFRSGYLRNGHVDIKPPLIHWSYKCWTSIFSTIKRVYPSLSPGWMSLRALPFLGMSLSVLCVGLWKPESALILGLLLSSPSLWGHMANTEWLTIALIALALALSPFPVLAWLVLGLTPWANQKNAVLVPIVAWAIGLPWMLAYWLLPPSILFLGYLTATGRLKEFWEWCYEKPKEFGKHRTLKRNTLSAAYLLWPALYLMVPFIATLDWHSAWAWLFVTSAALAVASKQIVPHHFILFALFLALGAQATPFSLLAFAAVWMTRDFVPWVRPSAIYAVTFGHRGQDYGMMLQDADTVEAWIRQNTKPDDTIWVNGMENQIYLTTGRKAWQIQIPELTSAPIGDAPAAIVHCASGNTYCPAVMSPMTGGGYEYKGYRMELVSRGGLYTLFVRE